MSLSSTAAFMIEERVSKRTARYVPSSRRSSSHASQSLDCGPLGDDEARIRLDGRELDRWEWVAADELDDYLIPRLARRVRSLLNGDVEKRGLLRARHALPRAGARLSIRLGSRSGPRRPS